MREPIIFEWLCLYESLRKQVGWRLDPSEVLPRFLLCAYSSYASIFDTSITEVVVVLRRNSPYYVAYTCTWILEPSVSIEWLWDWVTSLCRRLLLRLASSIESCHLAGMSIPPIPWPMTLSPTTEHTDSYIVSTILQSLRWWLFCVGIPHTMWRIHVIRS